MKFKKVAAVALAFAIALSGVYYNGGNVKEVKAATEWDLLWSDEFNGTSLDSNTWNYEIGNGNWGWGNGELEYYTNRTENVEVSDGTLKIKALKEKYGEQSYTSGRITTKGKQEFTYGKIEARMKLPSFKGAWPAFWTLGANQSTIGWPRCGEIDIMEAINDENNTYGALHWYGDSTKSQGDADRSSAGKLPENYNRTEWHTYGIMWDEKTIQWYVDDEVFFTCGIASSDRNEFKMDQFIIFNLAIGGQWPGYTIDESAFPDKSVMEVDYVRVYKEAPEKPTVSTEDTAKPGKTKVKTVKKKSAKTVQISLKKIKKADGYQVKISSNKNFKKSKTVTKTFKNVKFKVKSNKFKNKKKLYVKVRAYKIVNDKKIYGLWSKKKTVKFKK